MPRSGGIGVLSGSVPDSASVPPRATPTVVVEMIAPESINVGQPLTYELLVRNAGTIPVSGALLEEDLPARVVLISTEPAAEVQGERLSWSLGLLEPGDEKRIKVTVKPSEEGELRSRATISYRATVQSRLRVTRPRVTVAMTGPDRVRVGESVPFQIRLSNTGSGPAAKVRLQAHFSDGLSHPAGQVIEAELNDLAAGQAKTLTLEAMAMQAGAATAMLTVTADGNSSETARATVTVVEPLLTAKLEGPEKALVNGQPVYQLHLANPGSAATDPLTVWITIPEGFDFLEASDNGRFDPTTRSIGWQFPGLAVNGNRTLTLKLKAVKPAQGTLQTVVRAGESLNTIIPAADTGKPGKKPLEVRIETAMKAEGVPALRFQVIDLEDPVEVGKEAVYEVRIMNQGTGPCTGVHLSVELADGSTAVGAEGPTTGRVAGQQIQFDPVAELPVKAEVVYRIRVRANRPGDSRFRARVHCDQIRTPVVKEESTGFVGQP